MADISDYDQLALREIHAWKNPNIAWFRQGMKALNWQLDKARDLILATPETGDAFKLSIKGLTSVCNDLVQWSVRPEAIYEEFRKTDHSEITKTADVFTTELKDVDRIVGWLDAKYKGIALVEGAGTGLVGLPGIVKLVHRPINFGEWQQTSTLCVEGFVMGFNQPGEIIEIHQADGDVRAIRLIPGFAGKAAG